MFNIVTGTWNPISGCEFSCVYCWARELALTKLKNAQRYSKGFRPCLNEVEFDCKFTKGDFIFVSDMGDMFGEFIPDTWIRKVLNRVNQFPDADFLFMTKNPRRYSSLLPYIPKNVVLGATIETTENEIVQVDRISNSPLPTERYQAMKELEWDRKLISIEPIMDFNIELFVEWIKDIDPLVIYVGYDNYGHKLREPTLEKTNSLLNNLPDTSLIIRKTIRPAWFEENERKA